MNRGHTFRIAVRRFGPFESAISKQWLEFENEARTGLTLQAEAFDLPELTTALFTDGGLGRGEWDVAFLNTDWLAAVHAANAVVDLSPFLQSNPPEGYPHDWTTSLLRLQQIDGAMLGLPYHDGPECLMFRKDLFEDPREKGAYEARFSTPLRAPETWTEFEQIARFFQRPEVGLYGTAFAAFSDAHNTVYDFLLQLWTRNGELLDSDGDIQLDSKAAREGVAFYRSMFQDPSAIHPSCRAMDSVQSGLAFAAGEIAMMVNWFGFAAMSETLAASKVKGCVEIAGIPKSGRGASTSLNIYWILAIGAGSPHRDLAYRFLRHCASENMDKLLTLEGAIGCRKSTWSDPEVNRIAPVFHGLEDLHRNARELPRRRDWPEVAEVIDQVMLQAMEPDLPINVILERAQARLGDLR